MPLETPSSDNPATLPDTPPAILSTEEREERAMITNYLTKYRNWPLLLVAQETDLPAELLRKLVRDGVLAGNAPYRQPLAAGSCDIDQAAAIAQRLAAARAAVEGRGILAHDAATKYNFAPGAIYRWHKDGWVRVVGGRESSKLFNEGDIAVARVIANITNHKLGKPVFPSRQGRPKKV